MASGDIVISLNLENVEVIQDLQARLSAIERQRTESLGTIGALLKKGVTLAVRYRPAGKDFVATFTEELPHTSPHPASYLGCGETVEAAVAQAVAACTGSRVP